MVPITIDEYSAFVASMASVRPLDLNDPETLERLRISVEAPLEHIKPINDRTAFGLFRSSYTGHAFHNTVKGEISANSINLRPFHFLTYLAESGRIYIGSQYLGQYGGWIGLWFALKRHLKNSEGIRAYTFFSHAEHYRDAKAKEVRISISKNTDRIDSSNVFDQEATLVFKKQYKDDGFEAAVSKGILSQLGDIGRIKSAVAKTISTNALFDIADEDIQDCTVLASIGGQKKVIYLMGDGSFATKFPLDVAVNDKGHPEYNVARDAMLKVLEAQIIRRREAF